jgi:Tat protein secretion system quality control protein TatD with DNase activity
VVRVLETIAKVRGLTVEEASAQAVANAEALFGTVRPNR